MKRSNEPVFWGMFGAGGMVVALLTPVLILITGILQPLHLFGSQGLSYARVLAFAGNWLGAIIIWIAISLPMWHTMHRIYHGLHDVGIHAGIKTKVACYGFAFLVSVASATLLLQIFWL